MGCRLGPSLESVLRPGDHVLDIGANIGAMTQAYLRAVGPTGRVVAVEPCPASADALRRRYQTDPRVTVVEAAVGETPGEADLHLDGSQSVHHSLFRLNLVHQTTDTVRVVMTTVDDLLRAHPGVAAIKVDTQGAECEVLLGAAQALMRPDLAWDLELWPRGLINAGARVETVMDILTSHHLAPVDGWPAIRGRVCAIDTKFGHVDVLVRHRSAWEAEA